MMELLDHIPRSVATNGRYARELFTREGRLRHIHRLNHWPLERVLEDKYKFDREEVGPLVLHRIVLYCLYCCQLPKSVLNGVHCCKHSAHCMQSHTRPARPHTPTPHPTPPAGCPDEPLKQCMLDYRLLAP